MDSLPWHAGYFADEGELYEWEGDEGGEDEDEDLGGRPRSYDPDDWPDPEAYKRSPTSVTGIAATAFGLAVIESLIADMQRQLKSLPKRSGEGLKPIYGPTPVPGGLLAQVISSSETQITELQMLQNLRSQRLSGKEVSQEGLTQKAFSAAWGHKTEIVVTTVGLGALIYIVPRLGPAFPAFARVVPMVAALFIKTGRHAQAEAEFSMKAAEFDYLGQEISEIGIV